MPKFLNFNVLMAILAAVEQVEQTIVGAANKKQKAIEIAKTAIGIVEAVAPPKVDQVIGDAVDAVVAVANTIKPAA